MRYGTKIGKNMNDVQAFNRVSAIKILLEEKVISRIELAERLGLKRATITNIINEFQEMNIVKEVGLIEGKNGRSVNGLKLNVDNCRIIVARISRKYVETAVYDFYGNIHNYETTPINPSEPINITMDKIAQAINEQAERIDKRFVLGVGVAVPGPYVRGDRNTAYVTGFPALKTVDIEDELRKRIAFPVYTEHDSNMAVLAEWKEIFKSSNPNGSSMVFLTIEHGIGAGIIINGKIWKGSFGTAGEVGLMKINFDGPIYDSSGGTLEYYASNQAIKRYVAEKLLEYPDTRLNETSSISEIYKAYEEGDRLAKYAVEKAGWYLGCGIANIINILNPEYVVLGDRVSFNESFLDVVKRSAQAVLADDIMNKTKIVHSKFRQNVILLGACQFVLEKAIDSLKILDWLKERCAGSN